MATRSVPYVTEGMEIVTDRRRPGPVWSRDDADGLRMGAMIALGGDRFAEKMDRGTTPLHEYGSRGLG